jgi:putative acetyltransferase
LAGLGAAAATILAVMATSDGPLGLVVGVDDPHRPDVRALLDAHLRFCRSLTPLCHAYALDAEGLAGPDVTFFSARQASVVLGVGAVKRLDAQDAELKSMHTAEAARGRGVGQAVLGHLLGFARSEGYERGPRHDRSRVGHLSRVRRSSDGV